MVKTPKIGKPRSGPVEIDFAIQGRAESRKRCSVSIYMTYADLETFNVAYLAAPDKNFSHFVVRNLKEKLGK